MAQEVDLKLVIPISVNSELASNRRGESVSQFFLKFKIDFTFPTTLKELHA